MEIFQINAKGKTNKMKNVWNNYKPSEALRLKKHKMYGLASTSLQEPEENTKLLFLKVQSYDHNQQLVYLYGPPLIHCGASNHIVYNS